MCVHMVSAIFTERNFSLSRHQQQAGYEYLLSEKVVGSMRMYSLFSCLCQLHGDATRWFSDCLSNVEKK